MSGRQLRCEPHTPHFFFPPFHFTYWSVAIASPGHENWAFFTSNIVNPPTSISFRILYPCLFNVTLRRRWSDRLGKRRATNDDAPTRRDYGLDFGYPEYLNSTSEPDGTRDWGTQRVRFSFQLLHSLPSPFAIWKADKNVILSSRLLGDLDRNVDRVDHKLQGAMQRMRKFLRDSEEKGSGYCIVFLIIVLLALLLAVILL